MSKTVFDKLIGIYFRKSYTGFGEVTQEDEDYINNNEFICVATGKNGYQGDKDYLKKHIEIGKEYTLLDMNVSQSSSSLRLKELPDKSFNTVQFDIRLADRGLTITNVEG